MSYSQKVTTKKLISTPIVISSFVGMMIAVPLSFALQASMSASAMQQSNQATAQVNAEDFAKFAYAFNQGYEASAVSSSSSSGQVSCATVGAPSADKEASGTTQVNSVVAPPAVGGKGGGALAAKRPYSERTASMVNSFNSYTSMVNNSSSVTNVNSNNTVGSNNSTKTEIEIEKSKGVLVGVSNEQKGTQVNAEDSFNKDSYNTKNETLIINDSFKKDVDVTNTTTTTTDVDITKNVDVDMTDNSNSGNGSGNGSGNTTNTDNTDNSNSGNFSGNETEIDIEADVAVNSNNES